MTQTPQNEWTEGRPVPVANFAGYEFDSQLVGDRLAITVATPPMYEMTTELVPTLYVLDQTITFNIVASCIRAFALFSSGHFPQPLVVGVGYPLAPLTQNIARRNRDLTPTAAPFPAVEPVMVADTSLGVGGGPQFLQCLIEEVIPGIQARYRVHPIDRTLIGWSLSGLFGLYTLFHRPETFTRYLLVSPSIFWDEAICFSYEETWAKQHTDLAAQVFCAVGETEENPHMSWPSPSTKEMEEMLRSARMVSDLEKLTHRLGNRGYPNLKVESVVFPDEHHVTVFPAALSRGLVRLFTKAGEH
jgi:predicted alpha/beta superfamily hydrolase